MTTDPRERFVMDAEDVSIRPATFAELQRFYNAEQLADKYARGVMSEEAAREYEQHLGSQP